MIQRLPGIAALCFTGVIMLLGLWPTSTSAAWQANGIPVAPGASGGQDGHGLCPDGSGGAYIVWRQSTAGGNGDVYLQRMTSTGNVALGWSMTGLPLAARPLSQSASNLAPDLLGGAFVVWWTNEYPPLIRQFRLHRVLPNGSIAPGWPAEGLILPVDSPYPRVDGVCGDGQGGVYIVSTTMDFRMLVLHYTADGQVAPGWDPAGRPIIALDSGKGFGRIIPDANGGFIAIWSDDRDGSVGVGGVLYCLKITPSGEAAPGWPPDGVRVNSLLSAQEHHFLISDGAGGAYVGWDDNRNGVFPPIPLDYDIYGQHVLGNGTLDPRWPADGLPIVIAESAQYFFEMAEDGAGGVIFVWDDYRLGAQIYAVRIRPDATVAPGWTPNGAPVAPHPFGQTIPDAVGDGSGGVYAFWDQGNTAGNTDAIGQHLDPSGYPAAGWPTTGRIIAGGDASYFDPVSTSDGVGGAIVVYRRGTPTSSLIYAQRVLADGPVAIRISLLDSEVEPGQARLRWSVSGASSARATVYHRQGDAPWSERGVPSNIGNSTLEFVDRGLAAGVHGYRIGVVENGTESFSEESLVAVPSAYTLALAGFQPNPAVGSPVLGFTLSGEGAATITLHDVRGRTLLAKEVSSLGAGRHRVELGRDSRIAPGVYWIQLVQAGEIRRIRGVVVQ